MEIGTMISGDWFVDVSGMVCVSDMVDVSGMVGVLVGLM